MTFISPSGISPSPANPPATAPDWRARCRTEAESTASAEARVRWRLSDDAVIPFNFRWEHAQQVVRTALWLARETGADPDVAEATAWLHDVRKMEPNHGLAGAEAARKILAKTNFPKEKIEEVAVAITQHEGLVREDEAGAPVPPLEPLMAAILWDADKLTKLGVQALAYFLSGHHLLGLSLHERRVKADSFLESTLARTVASMNTEPGRRLAARRLDEMRTALAAWARDELL